MDYYMAHKAYKGQFDKTSSKDTDGNLFHSIAGFHKTQGRFSNGQLLQASWIGTSWGQEAMIILVCVVLRIFAVASLFCKTAA